jgi:hypothetical protein
VGENCSSAAAWWRPFCSARNPKRDRSPLFEIARVLVRVDHVASFIKNANHSVTGAAVKLCVLCGRRVVVDSNRPESRGPHEGKESADSEQNTLTNLGQLLRWINSLQIGQFVMNRTGAVLAGGGEYEPLPKRPKVKSRSSPEALALSKLHRREKDWRAKELVFPQQLILPTKNVPPRGRASGQTSWGVC